jgi:uncharacterized protein (DUF2062 family)
MLIFTNNNLSQKAFAPLSKKYKNLLLHNDTGDSSDSIKLQKAAKFAETENCELLIDAQDNVTPDQIECLLNSLSDDTTPTQILVADSNEELQPSPEEKRALLMLQLLSGEKICGFRKKFRLYPVKLLTNIPDHFYDNDLFYTRILIRGVRAGYKIKNVKIADFSSTSLLPLPRKSFFIAKLCKALLPWPVKRLCKRNFRKEKFHEFIFHPIKFMKFLLMENASPGGLAAAAATGMFLGTLPLLGFHTAAIIYVSIKLRLNKILSVNISHLCMPPFLPFACIEIGYYLRHGEWLSTASFQTIVEELPLRLLDWLLGALILAPANAILFAGITYIIAIILRAAVKKGVCKNGSKYKLYEDNTS